MTRLVQAPLLLTVFLFGPAGLLLVLLVTGAMRLPALPPVPSFPERRHVLA